MSESFISRTKELPESVFRNYSIGVVAANKVRGSFLIEVSPIEQLTMLDGELTDNVEDLEVSAQDAQGRSYSAKATLGATIQAEWLPFENSNRRTAPDVRRDEEVLIYQIADVQDVFYWTTLKDTFSSRRLETVRYLWSGDPNNSPAEDGSNCYGFEISTHEGHITLKTSIANGEKFLYTIQINAKDGRLVITDDVDNAFSIVSQDAVTEMRNANGCFIRLEGDNIVQHAVGQFIETVGGSKTSDVTGDVSEVSGGSYTTTATGPRTVNAQGINHSSSGDSVSSSSGSTTISGSSINLTKG